MSRKDTIIIAILINAGLLIVLFASALKSTTPQQQIAFGSKQRVVEPILKNDQQSGVDEVDQALQKLATAPQVQAPAYKVKKGDVLEKIARLHHTSVDAIIACNQLSSTNLRIGQILKIPNKKTVQGQTTSSPVHTTAATSSSDGHTYYTVKNGDNPWTIAVKNHMKVDELLKLNGIDQEKARKLKPGDKLIIK